LARSRQRHGSIEKRNRGWVAPCELRHAINRFGEKTLMRSSIPRRDLFRNVNAQQVTTEMPCLGAKRGFGVHAFGKNASQPDVEWDRGKPEIPTRWGDVDRGVLIRTQYIAHRDGRTAKEQRQAPGGEKCQDEWDVQFSSGAPSTCNADLVEQMVEIKGLMPRFILLNN
jgi:hypothetical protein